MNKYIENFKQFFRPLSPAQRTMFIGLVLVVLISVAGLFFWAQKTDYTLLFGSLQTDTAQGIVTKLDEKGISYKLEDSGHAIYVPNDKVHELRLEMAPVGSANSNIKGYELFDNNSLGMTDFMQQVNKKRALEGELARSINSLKQVESSRIHLVMPERSPFQESSVEASASVVLKIKAGQRLRQQQVDGITSLIAGSVEGLNANNVIVLDQAGNRLTDGINGSDFSSGDAQMQLREKTESYLTERGQTMLDRVLGAGNSILRVSVEHDFNKLHRESNKIDPESRTIISEQKSNQSNNNENRKQVPVDEFTPVKLRKETVVVGSNGNQSTSQTRNYEVNKTTEVFDKTQGEIERLTASVLINYKRVVKKDADGNEKIVSEPYSKEEIQQFSEVVGNALGLQPGRGDALTIQQIEFHDPLDTNLTENYNDQPFAVYEMIRWGLILVTFIITVLLIRSVKNGMGANESLALQNLAPEFEPSAPGEGQETLPENPSNALPGASEEKPAQPLLEAKKYSMDEIVDFIDFKPTESAKVLRAMMITDED